MTTRDISIEEDLHRDGYAVVRGIFSLTEIAQMRAEVAALVATTAYSVNGGLTHGPVGPNSSLAHRLLSDPRVALCNGKSPCQVFVHADTFNDWHADLPPGQLAAGSDGILPWMYKIVIYLQNHPERDGLSVVPGSHKAAGTVRGRPLHLGTCAGDVIVFDHRITHAGRFPNFPERLIETFADCLYRLRLVDYATSRRPLQLLRRLQHLLRLTPIIDRLAIFLFFEPYNQINQKHAALAFDQPAQKKRIDWPSSLKYPLSGKRILASQ